MIRRNRVKVWRSRLAGRWLIACADCEPYACSTFAEAIAWATDHATNHNPRTTA